MFADFRSSKDKRFDHVELGYSCLMWISGNPSWFCRIWKKDWLDIHPFDKSISESYGKTKFEAYRLALKNLK